MNILSNNIANVILIIVIGVLTTLDDTVKKLIRSTAVIIFNHTVNNIELLGLIFFMGIITRSLQSRLWKKLGLNVGFFDLSNPKVYFRIVIGVTLSILTGQLFSNLDSFLKN